MLETFKNLIGMEFSLQFKFSIFIFLRIKVWKFYTTSAKAQTLQDIYITKNHNVTKHALICSKEISFLIEVFLY